MIFRLHSTQEINTPKLVEYLITLYQTDADKAIYVFRQGFKTIPLEVILGVLETQIVYLVDNSVVLINTKDRN